MQCVCDIVREINTYLTTTTHCYTTVCIPRNLTTVVYYRGVDGASGAKDAESTTTDGPPPKTNDPPPKTNDPPPKTNDPPPKTNDNGYNVLLMLIDSSWNLEQKKLES